MDISEKTEAYFAKERPFKSGLALLRELALKTELQETFKWSTPVYTIDGKNVLGITSFKDHFGVWFFNGVFLKDPKNVMVNAQEGKTKSMRHWKFTPWIKSIKGRYFPIWKKRLKTRKRDLFERAKTAQSQK